MTLVLISSLDQLFRPELVFNFQVAKFSFFMHTFLISCCVVFGSSTGPVGTGPAGMVAGCPCVSLGLWRLLCVFTRAGSRRPGPFRCFCGSRDLQVLAKCTDVLCGWVFYKTIISNIVNICQWELFINAHIYSLIGRRIMHSFYLTLIPSFALRDQQKPPTTNSFSQFLLGGLSISVCSFTFV